MSTATKNPPTPIDKATHPRYTVVTRNPQERGMTIDEAKAIYEWTGQEADCPEHLYVNAMAAPIIVGSTAQLPFDQPRIFPGDRVCGGFYAEVARLNTGLISIRKLSRERIAELDKMRRLRTGDAPPPWVTEAWAKKEKEEVKA